MKNQVVFALAFLSFLVIGCEIEDTLTPREYPMLLTKGIKNIDNSGVTIDFEILSSSKSEITAYGIEYSSTEGSNNPFLVADIRDEIQSKPASIQDIKIRYDLVENYEYMGTPYVLVGGRRIYSQPVIFKSMGVNPPKIHEVSVSRLFFAHEIVIKGEYFGSDWKHISLEFSGLEEYFNFQIIAKSRDEVTVSAFRNAKPITVSGTKYDLILRSYGRTAILKDAFEIAVPQILEVSPTSLYVGDDIEIEISLPLEEFIYFYIASSNSGAGSGLITNQISEKKYKSTFPNLPAGEYGLSIQTNNNTSEYNGKIKVEKSWNLYRSINDIFFGSMGNFSTGEQIIEYVYRPTFGIYRTDFDGLTYQKIGEFPELERERIFYGITYSPTDRSIYFGLGATQGVDGIIRHHDFHRFDLESKSWQRLPDLSEGVTGVSKIFAYQGKIFVVFLNRPTFHFFDPNGNVWIDSGTEVPIEFRTAEGFTSINDDIYFVNNQYDRLELKMFRINSPITHLKNLPQIYGSINNISMAVKNNRLFISTGTNYILEYHIQEKTYKQIQSVFEAGNEFGRLLPINDKLLVRTYSSTAINRYFELIQP